MNNDTYYLPPTERKDSYIIHSPDRRGDWRLVIRGRYIGRYHSFGIAEKVAETWLKT